MPFDEEGNPTKWFWIYLAIIIVSIVLFILLLGGELDDIIWSFRLAFKR